MTKKAHLIEPEISYPYDNKVEEIIFWNNVIRDLKTEFANLDACPVSNGVLYVYFRNIEYDRICLDNLTLEDYLTNKWDGDELLQVRKPDNNPLIRLMKDIVVECSCGIFVEKTKMKNHLYTRKHSER